MKKFLFWCALIVSGLTLSSASAQDCCYPYQYDPCCNGVDFNGFYIGGNIGVISHTAHRNDLDGFLTDNSGWTSIDTGCFGGFQLGYDMQCCNKVFGLVWDWDWTGIGRRLRDDPNNPAADNTLSMDLDWVTTIRGRAGLAICDALVYVTLGGAFARFNTTWTDAPESFRDRSKCRCGWVGGVGTELIVWCNWSVGAEFLYMHFSDRTRTFTTSTGTDFSFRHADSAWVGRILINYRFGDLCGCFF